MLKAASSLFLPLLCLSFPSPSSSFLLLVGCCRRWESKSSFKRRNCVKGENEVPRNTDPIPIDVAFFLADSSSFLIVALHERGQFVRLRHDSALLFALVSASVASYYYCYYYYSCRSKPFLAKGEKGRKRVIGMIPPTTTRLATWLMTTPPLFFS